MLASLDTWALKDAVISTRGAKSCPLENTKCPGCSVTLNIGTADSPLTSPFGATSFGDENTSRKTLELSLEPVHIPQWDVVNDWAKTYIVDHSERLFKKRLSKDVVQENFKNQRLSMSFNESPRVSRVSKAPIAKHHRSASLVETQDLLDVTKDSE